MNVFMLSRYQVHMYVYVYITVVSLCLPSCGLLLPCFTGTCANDPLFGTGYIVCSGLCL